MINEPRLTKHGKQRIKERVGVGKSDKKVQRAAQLALERGTKASEVKGTLGRYLSHQQEKYKCGNNIRIYASQIWIFQDNTLVTVKPVPPRYQRKYKIYRKDGD